MNVCHLFSFRIAGVICLSSLSQSKPAHAGTSADYRTDFETTGMSAGASASTSYSQSAESGAESASVLLSADNWYSAPQGFAGQLYTVQSVELPEMDPLALESGAFTLHPRAFLDDLTIIDAPDRFFYEDLSAYTSTSAAGLCTTAAVYERVFADIYFSFEDVDNNGVVGIEDSDQDNYAAFGGDGVADYWQVQYFGTTWTPQAAAGADADGDGMDNRSEFRQGYHPADAASAFNISLQHTPGGTEVTYGPILRNYGIGYKLRYSSDLALWQTPQPALPAVNLPGGFRKETDAAAARRFYQLQWPTTWGGYNSFFQYGQNDLERPDPVATGSLFWTGESLLLWTGVHTSAPASKGWRYFPATDTWTPISAAGAPVGRQLPAAVWTGREMIVYGGYRLGALDTGGRYDPAADTWSPLPANSLLNRQGLTATWTGSEVIFCGGEGNDGRRLDLFNPATSTWRTVDPPAGNIGTLMRTGHAAVWTGTEFLVWGGITSSDVVLNNGWRFNPATSAWTALPASPLSARSDMASVWTGTEFVIWGGSSGPSLSRLGNGARFNPVTNVWTLTSSTGAPAARHSATAVWTGKTMVIWGGLLNTGVSSDGAAYDPAANTWTPLPSGPAGRIYHCAAWTGDCMFIYGGSLGGFSTISDELWGWVGAQTLVP